MTTNKLLSSSFIFFSFYSSIFLLGSSSSENPNFTFNGFKSSKLVLDGLAQITSNGLMQLTNYSYQQKGHAFYPNPVTFKLSNSSSALSFSSSFVFAIQPQISTLSGHGIVFVITPTRGLPWSLPSQYLGLFNESNNGNSTNHAFGVELDTIQSSEFNDINSNHVGIDINSLRSDAAAPASYFTSSSSYQNLSLFSGQPMRAWVEYDGPTKQINVTIAPIDVAKPEIPLLSLTRDLSSVLEETMYVGFSSATGSVYTSHYILGWSFAINGSSAPEIDLSELPALPRTTPKHVSKMLTIGAPILAVALITAVATAAVYTVRRKRKFAEEVEEWESEYGPHRFSYRDLYVATKGFRDKELLGTGGFGRVYRGILPASKIEVAVKKVSHDSRQGMREFVAEIVSIGRLRHRNLVQLLGYCRRKGELLLVYDYMPNGSLDKFIYPNKINSNSMNINGSISRSTQLNWRQRFKIIKGVASGLLYLHEEWEQVVVHRDIKASNVLLDVELNGRLGDFGLARLYDHGTDPQTTHVVGTLGYLAPEHTRTGKATRSSDVFAFGAFLLEVLCGRRPIDLRAENEEMILVDWVFGKWKAGELLAVVDQSLEGKYDEEEVAMVAKLGLMCSSVDPEMRPSMREVVRYLEGAVAMPDLESVDVALSSGGVVFGGGWRAVAAEREGFSDFAMSYPSSLDMDTRSSSERR